MILKTHEMINSLEEGGFSSQQAEAIVDWQTKIFATHVDSRLHKSDLGLSKLDLKNFERSFTINLVLAHLTGVLLTIILLKLFL